MVAAGGIVVCTVINHANKHGECDVLKGMLSLQCKLLLRNNYIILQNFSVRYLVE